MKVIALPTNGGKTTQLLDWVRNEPEGEFRVMVLSLDTDVGKWRRAHPKLDPDHFQPPSFLRRRGKFTDILKNHGNIVIGIDNIELLVQDLLPDWTIGAATINTNRD